MNCIAVDDEKLVRELLEDNIRQVPFLHLVKSCKNALEAAAVLQEDEVDLIFLDIQMPGLSGLQFLQSLSNPPLVVIITAYEKYALQGFNLEVVDYLMKPVRFERFLKACNRAYELHRLRKEQTGPAEDFFVHVEYNLARVVVADITYVEGLKDYIKIHLSSAPKPIITRMSMKAMEEKLPSGSFIRIHKSFLVAADKITSIKRSDVCIGEKEIPVSEHYKENLNKILNR